MGQELHRTANGTAPSRSFFAIMCAGACVASASRRQTAIALSTAEAEIYALCACVRLLLVLRRIAAFVLGYTLPPSVVYEDNTAVISMLKRRDLTARTRHIRVNLGFIVDAIDAREIEIHYVGTADQVADVGTNQRDVETFVRHRNLLLGIIGMASHT